MINNTNNKLSLLFSGYRKKPDEIADIFSDFIAFFLQYRNKQDNQKVCFINRIYLSEEDESEETWHYETINKIMNNRCQSNVHINAIGNKYIYSTHVSKEWHDREDFKRNINPFVENKYKYLFINITNRDENEIFHAFCYNEINLKYIILFIDVYLNCSPILLSIKENSGTCQAN
jgi:hypothetical protein